MAHALDVEPAGSDVGGDEDVDLSGLEQVKLGDAFGLLHVAVDFARAEARPLEALIELAHRRLAIAEDDRGAHVVLPQQVAQRCALVGRGDGHHPLLDVDVGARGAGDLDRLGIVEKLVRQLLDRRGHRCREQQGLPLLGQLGADFLDIGDEPHVEHAIGLVDHQERTAGEQDVAAAEQVHQPAGCRNQHVDALFERLDLIAHRDAADQQRHLQIVIFAVFLEILGDLGGELAGRLQDQAARHTGAAAAMGEDVDHRQHERRGLAGAGLGDADNVLHHQHGRNRVRLDRRRFAVTGFSYRTEKFVREAEVGKIHRISG